jgi:hypothetical protein
MHLDQPRDKRSVKPTATLSFCSLFLCRISKEGLFLAVDLVLASVKVGFMGLHHLGLHGELVAEDAYQVNWDTLQCAIRNGPLRLRTP